MMWGRLVERGAEKWRLLAAREIRKEEGSGHSLQIGVGSFGCGAFCQQKLHFAASRSFVVRSRPSPLLLDEKKNVFSPVTLPGSARKPGARKPV
jgi:hypothetical protein